MKNSKVFSVVLAVLAGVLLSGCMVAESGPYVVRRRPVLAGGAQYAPYGADPRRLSPRRYAGLGTAERAFRSQPVARKEVPVVPPPCHLADDDCTPGTGKGVKAPEDAWRAQATKVMRAEQDQIDDLRNDVDELKRQRAPKKSAPKPAPKKTTETDSVTPAVNKIAGNEDNS